MPTILLKKIKMQEKRIIIVVFISEYENTKKIEKSSKEAHIGPSLFKLHRALNAIKNAINPAAPIKVMQDFEMGELRAVKQVFIYPHKCE